MPDAPRILLHNDQTAALASRLRSACPEAIIAECTSYAALPDQLADFRPDIVYTVRFDGSEGYPAAALFGPNCPRWIANGGAGTDHFGRWDDGRVTVTNAAGVAADMMAEYVMGGFLHFTLDVPGLLADRAENHWRAGRTVCPVQGQTLLILGLGHTGRAVAKRAQAFGMRVTGTRAHPHPMPDVDDVRGSDDVHALLPDADFIAVSTPLTPGTRGLLGQAEFAAMKRGVILADVSRGGVIDQGALLRALRDGTVAGAALDVFETEPLSGDSPFWSQPNVLISPHCSSVHAGWDAASFELFVENLARWMTGRALFNVVSPQRGY